MTDWQPIETAGRDEGEVLVYGFDENFNGRFAVYDVGFLDNSDEFWLGPSLIKATHWMPLPDPPVERGASPR